MPRAFIGITTPDAAAREGFREKLRRSHRTRPELRIVLQTDTLLLAAEALGRVDLPDGKGMVLGRIARGDRRPADGELADNARMIFYTRGQELVERWWGAYVAFLLPDGGRVEIIRAPLGDLPCYVLREAAGTLISSSPRLLAQFTTTAPQIDPAALARYLAFGTIHTRETCLAGIEELPGGDRLTISAGHEDRSTLWSPWSFAPADRAILDPEEAANRVRAVTQACVAACAKLDGAMLLKLSGGLDSSIVAACLSRSSVAASALTLVTDDASGDERIHAQAIADHLRMRLAHARRDPEAFDPARSPAAGLPRPCIPGFRQVSDRLAAAAAAATGATAVLDGGGGDNVFCSLQSAAPVADCLLTRSGRPMLMRTATSLAAIANVSTLAVLRGAAARAFGKPRNHRWPVDLKMLSAEAAAEIPLRPDHPWLVAPRGTLPGRAAHVALIAAGQSYVEALDPGQEPALIAPLLAQPLVELCLRIPSWLWFEQGLNRFAARRAFGSELPQSIVQRRSKGSPDCFVAQILERNWTVVRESLLGGALAERNLLDRAALGAILGRGRPPTDGELHRIMRLFDAEVWARSWVP